MTIARIKNMAKLNRRCRYCNDLIPLSADTIVHCGKTDCRERQKQYLSRKKLYDSI